MNSKCQAGLRHWELLQSWEFAFPLLFPARGLSAWTKCGILSLGFWPSSSMPAPPHPPRVEFLPNFPSKAALWQFKTSAPRSVSLCPHHNPLSLLFSSPQFVPWAILGFILLLKHHQPPNTEEPKQSCPFPSLSSASSHFSFLNFLLPV